MAAALYSLEAQFREELTCRICLDLFTRPKMMPCGHTFCEHCLQDLASRGGTFQCPACRLQVSQGVSDLWHCHEVALICNILFDKERGAVPDFRTQIYGILSCAMCFELFRLPKVLPCGHTFCQGCLEAVLGGRGGTLQCPMCRIHVRQELKSLPDNHIVVSMLKRLQYHEMETREQRQSGTRCTFHPSKKMRLYCKLCQVPICDDCQNETHIGHRTTTIDNAAQEKRSTLQGLINEGKDITEYYLSFLRSLRQTEIALIEQKQQRDKSIIQTYDQMVQKLTERKDQLLSVSKQNHSDNLEKIRNEREILLDGIHELSSACNQAEQQLEQGGVEFLSQETTVMEVVGKYREKEAPSPVQTKLAVFQPTDTPVPVLGHVRAQSLPSAPIPSAPAPIPTTPAPIPAASASSDAAGIGTGQYHGNQEVQSLPPIPIRAASASSDVAVEDTGHHDGNQMQEFQILLDSIFSRLDLRDVGILQQIWSARTGQQSSPGIETELVKSMVKREYIRTGDLGMLQKDLIAAGICLTSVAKEVPGIHKEFCSLKTTEVSMGPAGGVAEISGFVKLVVPPGVLQRETTVTVSIVDLPNILKNPGCVNWISGYPWSLGKDACARELLDQVMFSPAIKVNLHGERLSGPAMLETWRPPASVGMKCLLLKSRDRKAWADITSSVKLQIHPDKISMSMKTFCPLTVWWTPMETVRAVRDTFLGALTSRTLDCWFAAYIKPVAEKTEFHVVCRDWSVRTNEYNEGFKLCGSNEAMFDLYNGDRIEVVVIVDGCQQRSRKMILRAKRCREPGGQKIQMFLDKRGVYPINGEVVVEKLQGEQRQLVCQLTFAKDDVTSQDSSRYPPSGYNLPHKSSQPEQGPGDTRIVSSTPARPLEKVSTYFYFIKENIGEDWGDLAYELGFTKADIDNVEVRRPDAKSRCRQMLYMWEMKRGDDATIEVLMKALSKVQLQSVVDGLKKKFPELQHFRT